MKKDKYNIAVIGAGAWGTALAQVYAEAGHVVRLYARDPDLAAAINKIRRNDVYLPKIVLSSNIKAASHLTQVVPSADIILMVTPTQYVREVLKELRDHLEHGALIVNCAKGIEIDTGRILSEVTAKILPDHPYAVLSGPTFAAEVAKGLPTAVTFATAAPAEQAQSWATALSTKTFRLYQSADPIGAEIAGAVKNVIAIACGIVEGRGMGQNAKAAVMTRGMAEIKRLGVKKGAKPESFLGLAGIGDLTLTCHSTMSRNYSVGTQLGQGYSMTDIMSSRRTVAEGVTTARAVADVADALRVEMPICSAINKILHHNISVDEVVAALLSRDLKPEDY